LVALVVCGDGGLLEFIDGDRVWEGDEIAIDSSSMELAYATDGDAAVS